MDLEFVDVKGRFGSGGRDNPHEDETWTIDDKPHKRASSLEADHYFTSFNHFIDIKEGPGLFDDMMVIAIDMDQLQKTNIKKQVTPHRILGFDSYRRLQQHSACPSK
jgi:hypothetical protein